MKNLILKTPSYEQLETAFREWLELLGYSERSVYSLPNYLREFLYWLEAEQISSIQKVHGTHAKAFVHQVSKRANQRREGGLSQNHLNKYIQSLKLFSKYIRSTGQGSFTLDMNMTRAESPYLDGNKDILTVQEIQGLYKASDYTPYTPLALRDKAMLSIFYGCGLRRNEGVMLDTEDILFDKKLLYVRKGKHYRERYVPMSEKVIEDLATYLYDARPYIVRGRNNNAFFVSDRVGARMQGQSLMVRLKKLQNFNDNLQQKEIGLHTLRHSIATHLLQAGMKLQDIATFLGHKTLDSTQIYTHIKYTGVAGANQEL
ncbi:MAG: tyrosine-type recombinase/integrase [Cyclobacteriaceae bacterium]|nr:tyrosine-type recombinase/integrase [Cyclobacteriaceae bacterium]